MALPLDDGAARPGKTFLADTDAIADRLSAFAHLIQEFVGRIDDDRPRLFAGRILHDLAQIALVHLFDRDRRQLIAVVFACRIHGLKGGESRIDIHLRRREGIAVVIDLDDWPVVADLGAACETGCGGCSQCSQKAATGKCVLHH